VKSLLARLLLVVAVAVVPFLAIQAYLEYQAHQTRQRLMQDDALRLVGFVASEQQRILDGADQLLSGIIATPAVQDTDVGRCQRLLANLLKEQPRYTFAAVLGLDGHTICGPHPIDPGVNASNRTFFRLALQTGSFVVGDYVVGDVTGQRSLHLARPFRDGGGKIVGVIALALSVDWLNEQLSGLALPPKTAISIMDRNGTTVARYPDPQRFIGQPMPAGNRFLLEGSENAVATVTARDGTERVVGYSPLGAEPRGLLVAVGLDQAVTFATVTHADRIALLLIAAAVGLALSLTALVGWRVIRRPINRLLEVADRWRVGDLAARTGIRADSSEFGRLAQAVDSMAASLEAREGALGASEARLQLAREAAGFGIWDWDIASDTMVWSDEQWLLHGLAPRPGGMGLETESWNIHPDDCGRVSGEAKAAVADPTRRFDIEYRVLHPDGSVHWLMAKARVVHRVDGTAVRMVGLSLDVTESREKQAALRRLSEDLEVRVREEVAAREAAQARAAQAERLQALGQLAGGIAHDFNNALQAIAGAASLIERRPGVEAGVRRLARITLEAADRGASITRRLLAFGRRGDLRAEALDAAALLGNLRVILVHTLGATIEVQIEAETDGAALMADKGQLETALVNLAANARDAMPNGGRLTLSARTDIVSADAPAHPVGLAPGRYVRLTVADNGSGMDAATLRRAGEPFFTTKGVGAGTGLGLSMARGFAEQSGGALRIDSTPGLGTKVTLWLPEAASARPAAAAPKRHDEDRAAHGSAGPAAPGVVLLVDDEEMIREMFTEHLQDVGYRVLVAATGAEALACLGAGEAVDVLVTDLSMPGMDGLELIREAQSRRPGLPAVLLTGYAGDGAALAVGGAVSGTFSLLRKPVTSIQLIDRIQSLLAVRSDAGP
jgi:signal transduction histidine kinase/ActR/RegA family two-component response regulator/HAMP domain-containing protein